MTRAIESIKRHYSENSFKSIEVPEWVDDNGQPLKIYYSLMTVQTKDRLQQLNNDLGDTLDWLVSVLISEAMDAQGKPMFSLDEKPILLARADANIIQRITMQILKDAGELAAEKKT
jgi:hypothetical protein